MFDLKNIKEAQEPLMGNYKNRINNRWLDAGRYVSSPRNIFVLVCSIMATFFLARYLLNSSFTKKLHTVTWNMAAINNNPFEYWITHNDPKYNKLMNDVSKFINSPGSNDIPVKDVFSEEMFLDLLSSMTTLGWEGSPEIKKLWESDFKNRKIISEFITDGTLGKKRLASMPDRFTNTINTEDQGTIMRPSVINCYSGDLSSTTKWWSQWNQFMFETNVTIKTRNGTKKTKIAEMLVPIKKSKYPAITIEEEKISIPLQTLAAAIFDAILVHMMNIVGTTSWQILRSDMCLNLNLKKIDRSIEILSTTYLHADIIFLQEVAGVFLDKVKGSLLADHFYILYPTKLDSDRDQNSLILLNKKSFEGGDADVTEVTDKILKQFGDHSVPVEDGDLYAILVESKDHKKYLLASFHGDTNGLATIPVVTAMVKYIAENKITHKLLFGMDANTYEKPHEDQQGVEAFADFYRSKNLNSCYGPHPNPKNYTTFHARTHLQPQLNKAITLAEKDKKGDKNPKDFILFYENEFRVIATHKDNTGARKYIENMVFPTLDFPSDHGITSSELEELS